MRAISVGNFRGGPLACDQTMSADSVPLHGAHCLHCGDPVHYSAWSRGVRKGTGAFSERRKDQGKSEAWIHQDGVKRDHAAMPHDLRDPEVDVERQRRGFESAKIGVRRNLSKQFDTLHAQQTVDEIARGMGLS